MNDQSIIKLKARSKADKIRAKRSRGRPKLEDVYRQPNGQPSRAKNPPQKVALEARARLTGLNIDLAKDPRAATNLGRLAIVEEQSHGSGITNVQYDAIQSYLKVVNDQARALCSPRAVYDKALITQSDNEDEYAQKCKRAIARYNAAQKAIAEGMRENPTTRLDIVLEHVIFRDIAMPRYLGDLRILCNILHHHFNPPTKAGNKKHYSHMALAGL